MNALHDDINDLVEQRLRRALETGETVNVPDLASKMTESLADLVVCGAPAEGAAAPDRSNCGAAWPVRHGRPGRAAEIDSATCLSHQITFYSRAMIADCAATLSPALRH